MRLQFRCGCGGVNYNREDWMCHFKFRGFWRVLRGPCSLCAYLGVPKDHPLAGYSYDDIPLRVHGGLTYSGDNVVPDVTSSYWYGWDYAHSGDACQYRDGVPEHHKDSHHWTVKEVVAEAKEAVWDFRKVVLLSERMALKSSGFLLAKGKVY